MLDQILNVLVQMYYKQLGKTQQFLDKKIHFENKVEKGYIALPLYYLSEDSF